MCELGATNCVSWSTIGSEEGLVGGVGRKKNRFFMNNLHRIGGLQDAGNSNHSDNE